jgi:hypothetical protein
MAQVAAARESPALLSESAAAPAAAKTAPPPSVPAWTGTRYVILQDNTPATQLNTFHLWVSNGVVRVEDADGAVYEGRLQALAPNAAAASRRQTTEKASARELLSAPARKVERSAAATGAAAGAAGKFVLRGRHPQTQQEVEVTGEWPPAPDGVLRLQLRLDQGPAQTLTARPAGN